MCRFSESQKRNLWILFGAGAVSLLSVSVYLYLNSSPKSMEKSRKNMVEAMIREAEDLIRDHR